MLNEVSLRDTNCHHHAAVKQVTVPCSWRQWGAIRVASGLRPTRGWWLLACVQEGTLK